MKVRSELKADIIREYPFSVESGHTPLPRTLHRLLPGLDALGYVHDHSSP
jgi:hypothetical protein